VCGTGARRRCIHRQPESEAGEELQEYLATQGVEELADLVEVVCAIVEFKGLTWEQFERIRLGKREDRGGFSQRLYLEHVSE